MIFRPRFHIINVLDIDEKFLKDNGIDGLILDLDNTLSLHGAPAAEAGIPEWLDKMRALGVKMVVVSNNTNHRVAPLARKLGLPFIANGAKPLTIGITRAIRFLGIPKERTAVVGDQIFTDVMGGNFARTQTILVEPFHEEKNLFFKIKRAAENIVFRRGEDLSGKKGK
ncbi:MAG: YqeG family HAD IIIA-type phosphatase [Ruminiclostridium sp.]|nr:YqeG family HAD IIIA-type phosphatase [Ruminiclostridium sp.]